MLPKFSLLHLAIILIVTAAAVPGALASGPSSIGFTEVWCGTPPSNWQPGEPVVLPPHEFPITVPVSITNFAFDPQNVTINVWRYGDVDE